MSTDRDVTRIVRSWLEDGATALPDRVLDNVLDQLPATPQRRSWWPARRLREMNMPIRLALVTADADGSAWRTRENTTAENHPILVVTYVP